MAITAAVATVAIAAGSTVYNISEQKKAAAEQSKQAADQEAQQAALANEAKVKENANMAQAFAISARKRGQTPTRPAGSAPTAQPTATAIGSSGVPTAGTKTILGS